MFSERISNAGRFPVFPEVVDTLMYHNICPSSVVKMHRIVSEKDFCNLRWLCVNLTFDHMIPKVDSLHAVAWWNTCANWLQNQFTHFQNIVSQFR